MSETRDGSGGSREALGTPEVVVFDLGSVLIEVELLRQLEALPGGAPDAARVEGFWSDGGAGRRFEVGEISPSSFAAAACEHFGLRCGPEAFLESFRSWVAPFPGAPELVRRVRTAVPVACLSNTNALHVEVMLQNHGLGRWFDATFFSNEIGAAKPDAEAYLAVIEYFDVPPDRILFLDDRPECVAGARATGLRAEQVVGVEGARRALERAGLLP